ncbi:MAG: glycosyltransferase family 39 protein [Candidatus Omnitrophota bacterium]
MYKSLNLRLWSLGLLVVCIGLFIRFWRITDNQFLFYDEGMYLGYNRNFLDLVTANPPKSIHELFIILGLMFKTALGTAKALWFFLLNLRVFFVGSQDWYFARIISAVAGVLTIILTYFFANRYFQSRKIAIFSVIFLTFLPSHVFYSRLGMQESLSALLFLSALYLYLFYKPLSLLTLISALLLSFLFLTNYRMIISPIFIIAIEIFEANKNREAINWKKLWVHIAVFSFVVFFIGSLYKGINRYVTFGWMFHQAQEAQGQRNLISFFSYPYYVIALEGVLFAYLFWENIYLIFRKQWLKLLPFILVLLQMAIFSFAAEKGARYLCVVLPLMTMAAAVSVERHLDSSYKKYVIPLIVLVCLIMGIQSLRIANSSTDYAQAVALVLNHDPKAKILSTQALTEALYIQNENDIKECPKNSGDFVELYKAGYHYLILDPQAYISWTKDAQRFSPPLIDFLEFIHANVPPIATLKHLNGLLLKRLVLDHNQNLPQSIGFLNSAQGQGYGQIRIYDIGQCLMLLKMHAMQTSSADYGGS